MPHKKDTSPVRLAINNAKPVAPASSEAPRRPAPPPLPPSCPIFCIGMGEGVRWYLNGARQLIGLKVKEHTRLEIMGLFGEDADLVHEIWPKKKMIMLDKGKSNEREIEIVTGWDTAAAEMQLLRLTAAKGIWSPTEKARGRGCWQLEDGTLAVNIGASLMIAGHWQPAGLVNDLVFVGREAIMKPVPITEPGGSASPAVEVLHLLQTWNWRREIDARLLLGWIVCAFLGAALLIRPVAWVIGPRSTGKSTLQSALAELMGGWLMAVLDPTPASIWQTLRYDALPVAIDEAEPDEDKDNRRRLNELIKLARLSFSGGKLPRGGADGEATEYSLRSAMLFSSINRPPLLPQDRSRMIVMRLAKLPTDRRTPDVSRLRLRVLGARLLRRAIDGWPRLAAALEQYRIALKAVGHEGRSSEVFGIALAAADIVLSDDAVDSDSAAELAAQLDFATLLEAEDDLSDEQSWLGRLLTSVIPLDGTGPRNTIAAWLRRAVEPHGGSELFSSQEAEHFRQIDRQEADRWLGQYGIKVIRPKAGGRPVEFAIANHGAGLERLHEGTHWAGRSGSIGGWKAAASELDGAHETTQRFGDWRGKGVAIPLRHVFPAAAGDVERRAPEPAESEP
jgi:hypothetical protein